MFPHLTGTTSSGYGSTETGLLSSATNWMLRTGARCRRHAAYPTVSIRITDDLGHPAARRASRGTSRRRSWQSMIGYWDNPGADAETIRPGRWIRTGDFGRLEDGVLFISTRLRDLIIRGARTSTRSRSRTASTSTPR